MPEIDYNKKVTDALIGRRILPNTPVDRQSAQPMLSLWGADAGFPESDIHNTFAYRIWLRPDENNVILGAGVLVEGELLSPCSGYAFQPLDEFDWEPILNWCLAHTGEADA